MRQETRQETRHDTTETRQGKPMIGQYKTRQRRNKSRQDKFTRKKSRGTYFVPWPKTKTRQRQDRDHHNMTPTYVVPGPIRFAARTPQKKMFKIAYKIKEPRRRQRPRKI
jgi:hypothetical protein